MTSRVDIKKGRLNRKYLLKEIFAELEWEVTSIKSPNVRLTSGDVRDYYISVKKELLKRVKNRDVAFSRKGDEFDFAQISRDKGDVSDPEDINYWINNKVTSLRFIIGDNTDRFWVEISPGKDFDFEKTKNITTDMVDVIKSVPTTKKVEVCFTGDNGFIVIGKLAKPQKVDVVKELLAEKLEDYCEDRSNVIINEAEDNQLQLDISRFKNTGSFPVPYSLNSKTGLVVVPVSEISSFKKEDAEIKKILKRFRGLSLSSLGNRHDTDTDIGIKLKKGLLAKLVVAQNVVQFSKHFRNKSNDFYDNLLEDAKEVRTQNDFDRFTAKYKIEDIAGAYAVAAALGINQHIFKGGEANINEDDKIDMLQSVLFHPERKYGLRKAFDTYTVGQGTSLHTHVLNFISALKGASSWVINALMKDPAWYPQDLREKGEGDEGIRERKIERLTSGDVYTAEDIGSVALDLGLLIDGLKKGVAKWGPNPVTRNTEQALNLLGFLIAPVVSGPAAEFFARYQDDIMTEKELMESVGVELPELTCFDCGQRYTLYNQTKSLEENLKSFKKDGCEKVNSAPEHQITWNDNEKYDEVRALTDPGYKYRVGIERQTAGSNSGITPIAIDKKKVIAADKFRVPFEKKEPKPISEKWRELAKTQIETEKTLEELSSDSYEYKRRKGLNFKEELPSEGKSNILKSKNDFDKVIVEFKRMLETSPQTKEAFKEFQEVNNVLSNLVSGETSYSLRQIEEKE